MLLVLAALEKIFSQKSELKNIFQKNTAMILGSSHGEIGPTLDFLKNLGAGEGARPFFFQNSLYSSTLGFLSHYFKCEGASYSVTDGENSAEAAFLLSETLLEEQGECELDYVVVCSVDIIPQQVQSSYEKLFSKNEGASVFILSKKHPADLFISLEFSDQKEAHPENKEILLKQKYQSGALQAVSENLCETEAHFILLKEKGLNSIFHIQSPYPIDRIE